MLHMRMCSSPTSNSLGKKRRFTCFHSTRLVIVLFTCLRGMFGQLADNNSGGDNQIITIHISDFGIEQPWHNDMRAGDSLEYWNSGNLLHKDLPRKIHEFRHTKSLFMVKSCCLLSF